MPARRILPIPEMAFCRLANWIPSSISDISEPISKKGFRKLADPQACRACALDRPTPFDDATSLTYYLMSPSYPHAIEAA